MTPYGNMIYEKKFNYNKRFSYFSEILPLNQYKADIKCGLSYYKLMSDITNYCVTVRRSSDDAEQDFGFFNGYIDYNSIVNFVGVGNNGYVLYWANQNNTNHAEQLVNANQPRIVINGVFEINGIYFDNATYMTLSNYAAIQFINPIFSIYVNVYQAVYNQTFVLSRHSEIEILSYDTALAWRLSNIGLDNYQISEPCTLKALLSLISNDANGKVNNTNGIITRGTLATPIANIETDWYIATRSDYTAGSRFKGNIKSIVMFNAEVDYNLVKEV